MQYLIYIAVLPVIVLLSYIYKKDIDKEPRGILTRLFVFGGISVIPIAIAELFISDMLPGYYLPTFFGTFVATFVGIGIIEEFGKWIITYICTYRRREYNHAYDGIVYAVFASLGFACVENVLYVIQNGIGTGLLRAVLAVPSHAVDAVIMGCLLSKSKDCLVNKKGNTLLYLFLSLLIPAITHSIYDAIILYISNQGGDYLYVVFFGFVALTYIISFILIRNEAKILNNFDGTPANVSFNNKNEIITNNVANNNITV